MPFLLHDADLFLPSFKKIIYLFKYCGFVQNLFLVLNSPFVKWLRVISYCLVIPSFSYIDSAAGIWGEEEVSTHTCAWKIFLLVLQSLNLKYTSAVNGCIPWIFSQPAFVQTLLKLWTSLTFNSTMSGYLIYPLNMPVGTFAPDRIFPKSLLLHFHGLWDLGCLLNA